MVSEYLKQARDAGVTWELDDGELERRLFQAVGSPIDLEWARLEMRNRA